MPLPATGGNRLRAFGKRARFRFFLRPWMAGRGPRAVGMAAVCGPGGSKRSAQASGAPLGAAEAVVGPGGFEGTLIELLLRDQKVVAQQGQETVVLRR